MKYDAKSVETGAGQSNCRRENHERHAVPRAISFGMYRTISNRTGPRRLFVTRSGAMLPIVKSEVERPNAILRVVSSYS
ncbi:hypothetical protein [Pedosphaera parvula]|uniref:hypothetical protein n=1 Tax=Pedosphaera parvula TaxID=1032527 RepID=UPI00123711A2|nr:hypothetical protein [Pedosphaera parvula]